MILAFETSTDVCSVAFRDAEGSVHEKRTERKGSHSEQLFLFTRELMEEQEFRIGELNAVLISEGPGSYTGLRIAASAVKGLLFGSDLPLLAVHTLASFAAGAWAAEKEKRAEKEAGTSTESGGKPVRLHGVLDARRVHLYHQLFEIREGELRGVGETAVRPIAEVEEQIDADDIVAGSGLSRLSPELLSESHAYGRDNVSAHSLMLLREMKGSGPFVREVDPALFDPKYYSSRQVK